MKIRHKIWLGVGVLVLLLLVTAVGGAVAFIRLRQDSRNLLKDNYRSLEYAHRMLEATSRPPTPALLDTFRLNLQLERHNITEPGEQALVDSTLRRFARLAAAIQAGASSDVRNTLLTPVRDAVLGILALNMRAIEARNQAMEASADHYKNLLLAGGAFLLLVLLGFIYSFPTTITEPLATLAEKMERLAEGDYAQQIDILRQDEIGDIARAFNQMALQLVRFEESNLAQLLFSRLRLQTIINVIDDAVLVLDEHDCFLYLNPAAENILNLTEAAVQGKKADDFGGNDLLKEWIAGGVASQSVALAIIVAGRQGHFTPFYRAVVAQNSKTGQYESIGHLYMLKDVSLFHDLDAAKTQFLATISHELRTPLSGINLSLQLLTNPQVGRLNSEQMELAENIRNETTRLLKLTGELLHLTQIESGRIQLQPKRILVSELVMRAVQTIALQAAQKHQRLLTPDDRPVCFMLADLEKTAWVLTNLLGNAVRYTPEGGEISVSWRVEGREVVITVCDSGPGIAPEYQDRIFEKYFRAPLPDGTLESVSGAGLGLAISREFIEAQNGRIQMESAPGRGSCFYVALPAAL